MSTIFSQIPGNIKYLSVIDRDNSPIILTNISDQEKELDFQLLVYSSLDLLEYKERMSKAIKKDQKSSKNVNEEYVGLLMPYYEFEYDIGVYGFIGNNGIKIILLKRIESSIQETASELKMKNICKDIHNKYIKLLLNPFYEKKDFYEENSQLRETFSAAILTSLKTNQIIY